MFYNQPFAHIYMYILVHFNNIFINVDFLMQIFTPDPCCSLCFFMLPKNSFFVSLCSGRTVFCFSCVLIYISCSVEYMFGFIMKFNMLCHLAIFLACIVWLYFYVLFCTFLFFY